MTDRRRPNLVVRTVIRRQRVPCQLLPDRDVTSALTGEGVAFPVGPARWWRHPGYPCHEIEFRRPDITERCREGLPVSRPGSSSGASARSVRRRHTPRIPGRRQPGMGNNRGVATPTKGLDWSICCSGMRSPARPLFHFLSSFSELAELVSGRALSLKEGLEPVAFGDLRQHLVPRTMADRPGTRLGRNASVEPGRVGSGPRTRSPLRFARRPGRREGTCNKRLHVLGLMCYLWLQIERPTGGPWRTSR